MTHQDKIDNALEAIDAVFGDSSVEQQDTVDALSEIIGHAQMLREAVEADMEDDDLEDEELDDDEEEGDEIPF